VPLRPGEDKSAKRGPTPGKKKGTKRARPALQRRPDPLRLEGTVAFTGNNSIVGRTSNISWGTPACSKTGEGLRGRQGSL